MQPLQVLEKYYGYDSFRPGQAEIIDRVLQGQNTLAIMPTGGGKSLCYQIPALILPGLTLVVSPLISLMKDQVDTLLQNGIEAAYLNSSLTGPEASDVYRRLENGQIKLLYVAPERFDSNYFWDTLNRLNISLIAIDEAHCISQWGHDFRPQYLQLSQTLGNLVNQPPIIALTATATPAVAQDICQRLAIKPQNQVTTGFSRDNLAFKVVKGVRDYDYLLNYLKQNPGQSGIIYAATRKKVEAIANYLNDHGQKVGFYHGGLSEAERKQNQEDFLFDRTEVMVATNAFGMGIDKSSVRFVIHAQVPGSLEAYYQEAGRAGRDGLNSEAILLYHDADLQTQRFFIENSPADEAYKQEEYRKLEAMVHYANSQDCLQAFIVRYFGQDCPDCGRCSSCLDEREEVDITVESQKILSCAYRMRGRFGKKVIAQVLAGSKAKRIVENDLQKLSTFGIMRQQQIKDIEVMIDYLLASGYLINRDPQYPTPTVTAKGAQVLKGLEKVTQKTVKVTANRFVGSVLDTSLFERLRRKRRELAEEQHVPPFVIFSDQTLQDLASQKPQSLRDMLNIKGIGETKLNRYGQTFLEIILAN